MYFCFSCTPSHNSVQLLNIPCSLFISFTKIASFLDLSIWILEHSPCTKSWSTSCCTLDTLMGSWCAYSVFPTQPNPSQPNPSHPYQATMWEALALSRGALYIISGTNSVSAGISPSLDGLQYNNKDYMSSRYCLHLGSSSNETVDL